VPVPVLARELELGAEPGIEGGIGLASCSTDTAAVQPLVRPLSDVASLSDSGPDLVLRMVP